MRIIKQIFIVIVTLVIIFLDSSYAMTKKMQIILKEVGSENGQLTKEIHSQFWSEFDKIGTKEEIDQVVKILKVSVLYIQEFHKELWECAQASYIHRRIEKTERFMELEQDLPNMFRQALTFPEGSSNYVEAVNVFNKKWKIIQRKKDKLLDAASNHTILVADDGRRLIINQEYITKKSNSLDSRFIRIKLLFDNEWKLN